MSGTEKRGVRRSPQESLAELKKLAQESGFELLETQWKGSGVEHRFRHIASGKEREWKPAQLFKQGFPKDLRTDQERSAESFLKLRQLAQANGFELLESEWLGWQTKHRFRHTESGREYEWVPGNIFFKGFPKDLRTDQDKFEQLRQLAQDNGYELLETGWLGTNNKHRFRHIESGSDYEGLPGNLFRRGIPQDLRTDRDHLDALRSLAQENGYELLETQWLGASTKHRFRHIESGKEREWAPNQLFNKQGFPKDLRTDRDHLDALRSLAQENGYELLETQWLGASTKHRFRHIESGKEREWMPAQLFKQGFPLADGQRFVTQEVIRQVFSHIFGGEFNTNHDRLKDKNNGKRLELDGYEHFQGAPDALKRLTGYQNEGQKMAFNLSVAFEFQGDDAHRKNDRTIELDRLKAKLCKEAGIHLMQIDPDLENEWRFYRNVRDSDFMYAYVCKAIASHFGRDIDFPPGFKIDLSNWNPDKESFKRLQELADVNGFELLETEWLGSQTKHRFRHIESGKEREWAPAQLFSEGFPKDLRTDQERSAESFLKLRQLATDNGYELLETEWLGRHTKHQLKHIGSGKEREWTPGQLFKQGFPKDLRTDQDRLTELFQHLKQLAQENGYELLETEWLGASTKHRFRHIGSGKEREWVPNQLFKQGFPKDLRTDQDRFEELKKLAQENGYELLETQWLGTKAEHRFRHIESGTEREWKPAQLFKQGFPKAFQRPSPTPPQTQPDIPTTGPTANWFQLNDPSGAKLKLARIDGVPLMFIVDLSPLDPKSDECVELLGFHRVPNNSFLVRRVQEGERITEDSLRKVFPMVCEESMSCTELLIERPAPEPATSDLSISPQRQQQASPPVEPELGPLVDHEAEAHADLDEPDEQEPDEQSLPVESCC